MRRYLAALLVLASACGSAAANDNLMRDGYTCHWASDTTFDHTGPPPSVCVGTLTSDPVVETTAP